MHEYCGRIIATRRSGGPTMREARADYMHTIAASVAPAAPNVGGGLIAWPVTRVIFL